MKRLRCNDVHRFIYLLFFISGSFPCKKIIFFRGHKEGPLVQGRPHRRSDHTQLGRHDLLSWGRTVKYPYRKAHILIYSIIIIYISLYITASPSVQLPIPFVRPVNSRESWRTPASDASRKDIWPHEFVCIYNLVCMGARNVSTISLATAVAWLLGGPLPEIGDSQRSLSVPVACSSSSSSSSMTEGEILPFRGFCRRRRLSNHIIGQKTLVLVVIVVFVRTHSIRMFIYVLIIYLILLLCENEPIRRDVNGNGDWKSSGRAPKHTF